MGAKQSKDELLYEQVNSGNVEAIKALRHGGACLEWMDREGKTPLILACTKPELLPVAKVLIELGANVNARRPGINGGTLLDHATNKGLDQTVNLLLSHHSVGVHGGAPLHHAANKGLEETVNLLLSHGANPLLTNDVGKTPLDLARAKRHWKVVRAIESRISLFSGWLRELYGPSILEAFAPKLVTRTIWAVVLPCDTHEPGKPLKLNLVVYPDLQVAKPLVVIALWNAHIKEPKFNKSDPAVIIADKARKTRCKFMCAYEGDRQELLWFYNACRGIPQTNNCSQAPSVGIPMQSPLHVPKCAPTTSTSPQASASEEDTDLAMAISASLQSALAEGVPLPGVPPTTATSPSNTAYRVPLARAVPSEERAAGAYNRWHTSNPATQPSSTSQLRPNQSHTPTAMQSAPPSPPPASVPSAPPIINDDTFYNSGTVGVATRIMDGKPEKGEAEQGCSSSSSCVICLDAPVEGACVPCGHMAGCMSCLAEIKAKKWGCPVCRAEISQTIKLYAV